MTFTYRGSLQEMTDRIQTEALKQNRDILIRSEQSGRLEIGFQRLGHSGGRFFIADVSEQDGVLTLTGTAKDCYSGDAPKSKARKFLYQLAGWFSMYFFLELLPFAAWWIFWDAANVRIPLWIPLLLPGVWFAVRIPLNRREAEKRDADFYALLSAALARQREGA